MEHLNTLFGICKLILDHSLRQLKLTTLSYLKTFTLDFETYTICEQIRLGSQVESKRFRNPLFYSDTLLFNINDTGTNTQAILVTSV